MPARSKCLLGRTTTIIHRIAEGDAAGGDTKSRNQARAESERNIRA